MTVKVSRIFLNDKELTCCTVIILCSCHCNYTSGVRKCVFKTVLCKFTFDRLSFLLFQIFVIAAALNHKIFNNSVEYCAIIKTVFCKFNEVFNRIRCKVRI